MYLILGVVTIAAIYFTGGGLGALCILLVGVLIGTGIK